MRVKIIFLLSKNSAFPINYNYYLASLIYRILHRSSHKFSSFLHNKGFELEGKHFKLFTFSQILFTKKWIEKDRIINLGETVEWLISSGKDEFIQHFIDGLFMRAEVAIEKQKLFPIRVETIASPQFNGLNKFTCLSPITMSTKVDKEGRTSLHYLTINDPAFREKIRENLIRKYRLIHSKEPESADFAIKFDEEYLKKKKNVSRLINIKGINIRGYMVPFTAQGNPDLINIGYECGFGDKNSLGFGMVKKM